MKRLLKFTYQVKLCLWNSYFILSWIYKEHLKTFFKCLYTWKQAYTLLQVEGKCASLCNN